MRLAVHVTPRAARDEVLGWRGTELQIRVTAPPADGKANDAVTRLVAASLGIPKSAVEVVRGESSRHKLLSVNAADDVVFGAFGAPEPGLF